MQTSDPRLLQNEDWNNSVFHYVPQHLQDADPKKATPAPAAGAPEAVKAKEEPKGAPKSSEAAVDNKPASVAPQAGDDAANVPKKLEKRNSIQLFFKNLVRRATLFPLNMADCLFWFISNSTACDNIL